MEPVREVKNETENGIGVRGEKWNHCERRKKESV